MLDFTEDDLSVTGELGTRSSQTTLEILCRSENDGGCKDGVEVVVEAKFEKEEHCLPTFCCD